MFWKEQPYWEGGGLVCGLNKMTIHLSEASILPSVYSSIHPFLQIMLVLSLLCGMDLKEPK